MAKSNLVIPNGYEQDQQAADAKRKIAQLMLQQGLSSNPNMHSWAQVLGQLAQAWEGKDHSGVFTSSRTRRR